MKRRIFIFFTLVLLAVESVNAQVTSSGAVDYSEVGDDIVYWYSSWDNAVIEAKSEKTATFEWYAFDEATLSFSKRLRSSKGTEDSYLASAPCGILCRVKEGEKTTETRMWVDVPAIDSVSLSIDSVYCDGMDVTASATGNPTRVYDSKNGKWKEISQEFIYNWYVADTLQTISSYGEATLESPLENSALRVEVHNQAEVKAEAVDSVSSYGVKAIFTYKERERDVPNEISGGNSYSSPAEIEFTNESKGNITVYEWVMGTMSRVYDKNPVYSFQPTGTHRVTLIATDEATGCSSVDSTLQITITDAFLGFPDVFSPNGDGVNDEFRAAYKSLKTYEITIYNRWGRKVYHSTDPSKGWDGKEGNSKATEGVYMYVAEALGYDKGVRIKKHGSVTLIR